LNAAPVTSDQKDFGMGTSHMLVSPMNLADVAGWLSELHGCWLVTVLLSYLKREI